MYNQNNRNVLQNRYHWEAGSDPRNRPLENPHYGHRGRGHFDGFRRPYRGNIRNFDNRNSKWEPWPQESENWNMQGNNMSVPPPMMEPRHFSRPFPEVNPHDENPYLMESSYDGFSSNENFLPFSNVKWHERFYSAPSDNQPSSITPSVEKKDTTCEPSTKDAQDEATSQNTKPLKRKTQSVEKEEATYPERFYSAHSDNQPSSTMPSNGNRETTCEPNTIGAQNSTKSQKAKPLKRKSQSVRAITNVSQATRSSVDSDDTLDSSGEKQEKRNSVSENSTGNRIAHWINPSNRKDEAEVRRLVTQFAKSKKKENLLKLKQQSESRMERKDSTSDEACSIIEIDKPSQDSPKHTGTPTPSSSNQSTSLNSRRRTNSNLDSDSDVMSTTSNRSVAKSSSTKASRPARVSSLQSDCSPGASSSEKKKRKSSTEKSISKVKKYTNSQDLDACLNAVVRGTTDITSVSETLVSNTRSPAFPEKSVPEIIVPMVKKEPVDTIENPDIQSFADSLNLNEFLQNQVNLDNNCSPEATMTPVESLINLFATGNIKVKKEFDDPLIDAIRTVDPAVLDRVCGNQSSTSKKKTPAEQPASKPHSSVTGSLKAILNQLQKISDREQKVKEKLQEADLKINEYQMLLDEWKTKKIKFQSEEEYLGHQRNTLVKSMNDLVTEESLAPNTQEDTDCVDSTSSNALSDIPNNQSHLLNSVESFSTDNLFSLSKNSNSDQRKATSLQSVANIPAEKNILTVEEEIAILPLPSMSGKKEVPVIDLDEACPFTESNISTSIGTIPFEDTVYGKLSEWKVLAAHQVVVNSIQVFEDYLYTSSNDYTAKRFNLKDVSEIVIYQHEKKNVTNLCVEKVNGLTVVFTTSVASNVVSAFKAEDGTFLNSFTFTSAVASLCKGKDKIYVGLRDGCIFTCNLKEQKEIVYIGDPLRSIALTYQGCISILVTLAVNGSVSIRDAERNGLLIRTVKPQKNLPLFMTVCGDCIYLSGSGVLMGIEIGTARCVQLLDLTAPYTSLTVYQGNIFTTSYSGLVRCHSKEKENEITVYYGAGNTALTCINVYNGWVFTGNRFGAVDVFKFDPNTHLPCQLGKCDLIFAREKDLELHALSGKDHDLPSAGSKCSWRSCRVQIPRNSNLEVIKCHIKEHIQASAFQDHFAL